jgi:Rps23 Pro-64 3,4-dihydroxylase Tpa1-like proline 4-hydroxylase
MHTRSELDRLAEPVLNNADTLRREFTNARPFRHICIDDFLENQFAERLLAEFPTFDRKLSVNEGGEAAGKAVNTKIREISPAYAELYSFISSKPFLEFMSQLSGIPDLLLDPKMFGGGTHENRHGQELDPHIDFNYAEDHGMHRRLNLIVYLNKDWKTEWGGAIEIHSNPRQPDANQIRAFDPIFNRAVMFETNEVSWHGFPIIDLPEAERGRSRKSISIYLYTKDRPAGEIAPSHGTFYVQRPLPVRIAPGHLVTAEDVFELKTLLARRDRWIELYQKMELDKNRSIDQLGKYVRQLQDNARVAVTGFVIQEGATSGAYPDGWISSALKVHLRPTEAVQSLMLRVYRPDEAGGGRVRILIDGAEAASSAIEPGRNDVAAQVSRAKGQVFEVEVLFDAQQKWSPDGDDRDLALMLIELRVESVAEERRPIYVARKLADAERLETVFTKAGIDYEVEPDTYQGGVLFRSTRVGAFFYVAAEWRERAAAVMTENGFTPLKP